MTDNPQTLGFYEDVIINTKHIRAKVDSGASTSSIDQRLAEILKLGPAHTTTKVSSSHGESIRPVVDATITIGGKTLTASFTIASRENLRYPLLIGKNILREGFIIDPTKKLQQSNQHLIKNTKDLDNLPKE